MADTRRYRVTVFRNDRQNTFVGTLARYVSIEVAGELVKNMSAILFTLQANSYAEIALEDE